MQRSKPEKFADFLLKIRKLVVEPESGLNLKDRCGLLHILESHLLRLKDVKNHSDKNFNQHIEKSGLMGLGCTCTFVTNTIYKYVGTLFVQK